MKKNNEKNIDNKMELSLETITDKFFEKYSFANVPLESYNWLIRDGFQLMFDKMKFEIKIGNDNYAVGLNHKGLELLYKRDTRKISDELREISNKYFGGKTPLFPIDTLSHREKKEYVAKQKGEIVIKKNGEVIKRENVTLLEKFPLMILSDSCPLSKIPREEWKNIPHCSLDQGGYFIYNTEKVLVNKESLAQNFVYIVKDKTFGERVDDKNNKPIGDILAENISRRDEETKKMVVFVSKNEEIKLRFHPISKTITLYEMVMIAAYVKGENPSELFYSHSQIPTEYTKYINENTDNDIYSLFEMVLIPKSSCVFQKDEMDKTGKKITSHKKSNFVFTNDVIISQLLDKHNVRSQHERNSIRLSLITKRRNDVHKEVNYEQIYNEYMKEIFSYIISDFVIPASTTVGSKLDTLFDMAYEISKYHIDRKGLTNKNYYGYKLITTAGQHLFNYYFKIFKEKIRSAKYSILSVNKHESIMPIMIRNLKDLGSILDKDFESNFSKKEWGSAAETKNVTVIEELPTDTLMNRVVITRKIAASYSESSKQYESRLYDASAAYVICPAATPDNKKCGLTKHLTISSTISNSVDPVLEKEVVTSMLTNLPLSDNVFKCFINNVYIGNVTYESYLLLRQMSIEKVDGIRFHEHTSVTLVKKKLGVRIEQSSVFIFTTEGRAVFPVLVMDKKKNITMIESRGLVLDVNAGLLSFDDMVDQGLIKYVDVVHSEFSNFALNFDVLKTRSGFDYLIINQSFHIGIEAATMNFPHFNPVSRIMLTAKQQKQAISIPFFNWASRRDLEIKKLWYPQRQLFQSKTYKALGYQDIGNCQNVLVAILTRGAAEQEDAFMMKKEYYELGGAVADVFKIVRIEADKNEDIKLTNLVDKYTFKHDEYVKYISPNDVSPDVEVKTITSDTESNKGKLTSTERYYKLVSDEIETFVLYKDVDSGDFISFDGFPKYVPTSSNIDETVIVYKLPEKKTWKRTDEDVIDIYETKELRRASKKDVETYFIINDLPVIHERKKVTYRSDRMFKIPRVVQKGDIIAEVTKVLEENKSKTMKRTEKSLIKSAVVDDVFKHSEMIGATKSVKIRFRSTLYPQEGDKFAFPYGQKGVLGTLLPAIDMPRLMDGRVPDIIINAANFPSRNTIGLMLEMLAGKSIVVAKESDTFRPIYNPAESTGIWKPLSDPTIFTSSSRTYFGLSSRDKELFDIMFGFSTLNLETIFEVFDIVNNQLNIDYDPEFIANKIKKKENFEIPRNEKKSLLDIKFVNSSEWKFSGFHFVEKLLSLGISKNALLILLESIKKDTLTEKAQGLFRNPKVAKFLSPDVIKYFIDRTPTFDPDGSFQIPPYQPGSLTLDDLKITSEIDDEKNPYYVTLGKMFGYSIPLLISLKRNAKIYVPLLPQRQQLIYNTIYKKGAISKQESLRDVSFGRKFQEGEYSKLLSDAGFDPLGSELLVNRDSEIMGYNDRDVFIPYRCSVGYSSVLRLKHCVAEKYQSRNTGSRSISNNQPLRGKDKQGGITVGEMETWAAIAQGMPYFLMEKLRDHSDRIDSYICTQCKQFTSSSSEGCSICPSSDIVRVPISYSLFTFDKYNGLMGNKLEYTVGESDNPNVTISKLRHRRFE